MTEPTPPAAATAGAATPGAATPGGRRVILWRPDTDASHVEENLDRAARFLDAPADAVASAIERGELLGGWFVDWAAGAAAS